MTTDVTLETMKEDDLFATVLNYLIFNSVYYDGTRNYVSLIHKGYSYIIPFEIYSKILKEYPNLVIHYQSKEYNFCSINISLNMLTKEFILDADRREKISQMYYPYDVENPFVIYSKLF